MRDFLLDIQDAIRERSTGNLVLIGAIILALILVLIVGRQGFRYATESKMSPVKGVDVSSYQGEIDWRQLKREGVRFAYIKATEGTTHVDPEYGMYSKKAHRAGLVTGAYHFLSFDTGADTQAENFIDTVEKSRHMLPPAVDLELYGEYESARPDKDTVQELLDEVLFRLEDEYGTKPVIYTNPYVYDLYLSGDYEEYRIWISDPDLPETLSDGKLWTFCQYSFTGETSAVESHHIDLDRYDGSLWELKHMK